MCVLALTVCLYQKCALFMESSNYTYNCTHCDHHKNHTVGSEYIGTTILMMFPVFITLFGMTWCLLYREGLIYLRKNNIF